MSTSAPPTKPTSPAGKATTALRGLGWACFAGWVGWTVLAVLLGGSGPNAWRGAWLVLGVSLCAGIARWHGRRAVTGVLAGLCLLATLGYLLGVQPSHDRAWTADQARMPRVVFEGDRVTIENHRAFRYRTPEDYDEHWTTETFDLSRLEGADLGVAHFSDIEAVAHTFVSFRFADGRVLVASVEIRKEEGESFSPLLGLFRSYELMIVLGDERDLVELRAVHREDTVYLLPLDISGPRVADFLRRVLAHAQQLHDEPAFYNTLTASCSSTLAWHLRALEPVGLDPRMFLPGYTDDLAYEWGWLAGQGSLEERMERHRIEARARQAAGRPDFSERIRSDAVPSPR